MKKTGIILALLLITVCAFAQAPDWQWATKADGSNNDAYLFPRSRVGTQCSNALRQNQIGIDSLVLY